MDDVEWYPAGSHVYELDGDEVPVTPELVAWLHNELIKLKKGKK